MAFCSGLQTAVHSSSATYAIYLHTTGGQASQWVINWGDGSANTTIYATSYTGSIFPLNLSVSHAYTSAATRTITATATLSGTSTTSVATFGLDATFGTYPATDQGKEVYAPYADAYTSPGNAVAVDTSGNVYVAAPYRASSGNRKFGITRFVNGQPDSSWGDQNGTLLIPNFSGSTSDTPLCIAASDAYVAVAGTTSSGGWAVALISWGLRPTGQTYYGQIEWKTSGGNMPSSGKPNTVIIDTSDNIIYAAGDNGTNMTVVAINSNGNNGGTPGALATNFGGNSTGVVTIDTGGISSTATGIVDTDAGGDLYTDKYLVAGTTLRCDGCGSDSAQSDVTLVELGDYGGGSGVWGVPVSGFGNNGSSYPGVETINCGCEVSSLSCHTSPSVDSVCGLVEWQNPNNSDWEVIVAGHTDAFGTGTPTLMLTRFNITNNGSFDDTNFGYDGVLEGALGTASGVAMATDSVTGNTEIVVSGQSGNDFLAQAYNPGDGTVDTHFGNTSNNTFLIDFGTTSSNTSDTCTSIAVGGDGSIILCGYTPGTGGVTNQIALADVLLDNQVKIT